MSDSLSPREKDVLQMVWDGLSNKDISKAMGLSVSYVKNVQDRIRIKLNVSSKVQMVRCGIERGWLTVKQVAA